MNEIKLGRQLTATLYPLSGLEGKRYSFRVLKIRENIPRDNNRPIRLQRWADRLWRKELRCPVYATMRFGYPAFLIPLEHLISVGTSIEINDVPDKHYHIDVTDEIFEVSLDEADRAERELICRMVERPFTDKFQNMKRSFWKAEWTLFFRLKPENHQSEQDIVNAYRGLKFGVTFLQNGGPHFAADIRTRYVGKKSFNEYSEQNKKAILQDHLDLTLRFEDKASFVRDNGAIKIPCKYSDMVGKTVDECTYDSSGATVYEYYLNRYPGIHIEKKEPAVHVQDRREGDSIPVPASRLFPIFTTDFEGIRNCSIRPQMTPMERASTVATFLRRLNQVKLGDSTISIQGSSLVKERTVFIPPRLEFGKGEILEPFPNGTIPPTTSRDFDSGVVKWSSSKLPALYKAGVYHNEPLPEIVLLYPQTVDRPTRETFLHDLKQEIYKQTGRQVQIIQQRSYSIGSQERRGSSLLRLVTEVRSLNRRVIVIAALWDRFMDSVHGELKNTLDTILSQCLTEKVLRSIGRRSNPQKANSQVRNLSLAVLTEAGVKPWVLADQLHHDLHIGIDLLYGRIGYNFLYGTGGRLVHRQPGESRTKGRYHEAIKQPDLERCLEESIRGIIKKGHPIHRMVIHRDGRWWPSEEAALHAVINRLQRDATLRSDFQCAVVEVRKNHLPIRLFTLQREANGEFLQNPLPGTYLLLDKHRVILTTTGRPGAWDNSKGRTAGTLLLEIVSSIGQVDIRHVAEDAYRLTHLNWNAPDIEIALPVTIRWADEALRETLRSSAKEDGDEEESTVDDDSDEISGVISDEEELNL